MKRPKMIKQIVIKPVQERIFTIMEDNIVADQYGGKFELIGVFGKRAVISSLVTGNKALISLEAISNKEKATIKLEEGYIRRHCLELK